MAAFTYPPTTTLTIPPINFHEQKEGSQDAALSVKAQVYKTIWKVAWSDAENAKTALLGFTRAITASGGNPAYYSRLLPHAHPTAPWLFCTDVLRTEGREPLGGSLGRDANGMAVYKWAFLYCTYTKLHCAVLPDRDASVLAGGSVPNEAALARFIRKRRRSLLTFQSNRRGAWQWVDNGKPVGLPIPWRVPLLRLQLTWMGIPIANLNEPYINDTIGTTNLNAFGGYRAGSLLLNGADWPDFYPTVGTSEMNVDVLFDVIYFPPVLGGPNFQPDPNRSNTYHEVATYAPGVEVVVGGGPPPPIVAQPFPKRDWAPMFTPINI